MRSSIHLLHLAPLAPLAPLVLIGFLSGGCVGSGDCSEVTGGDRADPPGPVTLTYLIADGVGAGSTAVRIDAGGVILYIEAFPASGMEFDPAEITDADIILQSPHGHVSHYDAGTVAVVQKNSQALVVGNSQLREEMLAQGVAEEKIIELQPSLGGHLSIELLGVTITSCGMQHLGGTTPLQSFLIETSGGVRIYHGTCTSQASIPACVEGGVELRDLDVMILCSFEDLTGAYEEFTPKALMKVHDFSTGKGTIWTDYPSEFVVLEHGDIFPCSPSD
jgi:hypothetical protein